MAWNRQAPLMVLSLKVAVGSSVPKTVGAISKPDRSRLGEAAAPRDCGTTAPGLALRLPDRLGSRAVARVQGTGHRDEKGRVVVAITPRVLLPAQPSADSLRLCRPRTRRRSETEKIAWAWRR
jgi:hypothetical protein